MKSSGWANPQCQNFLKKFYVFVSWAGQIYFSEGWVFWEPNWDKTAREGSLHSYYHILDYHNCNRLVQLFSFNPFQTRNWHSVIMRERICGSHCLSGFALSSLS